MRSGIEKMDGFPYPAKKCTFVFGLFSEKKKTLRLLLQVHEVTLSGRVSFYFITTSFHRQSRRTIGFIFGKRQRYRKSVSQLSTTNIDEPVLSAIQL